MDTKFNKIVVSGKIDLDTCGVAVVLLRGNLKEMTTEVVKNGQATEVDLTNPDVLCIEAGGSGRVVEGNFDHHGAGSEGLDSATMQAWHAQTRCPACGHPVGPQGIGPTKDFHPDMCAGGIDVDKAWTLAKLVEYIDELDTKGPKALPRKKENLPTLSDVFAGMLLTERDPAKQFILGVKILQEVVQHMLNPYGRMPVEGNAWMVWTEAKRANDRLLATVIKTAKIGRTQSGKKLGWVETDFWGAPGALYGIGAEIVVAFSPRFGPDKIRKFTVAGNGIRVDAILPELNTREIGWGGPGTGTILGSPREGSVMTLNEVIEIVKRTL